MSNTLKLWPITVTNPLTREAIQFLGQGTTVGEAVADGAKNCGEIFRPNQSGSAARPGEKGGPNICQVIASIDDKEVVTVKGRYAPKSLREFEADPAPQGEEMEFA